MEKEYIRKAIEGNNQAFEKLVVLYQRRLFGFIKGKEVNSSDIQEIVQETFLQCFINLKNIRNIESFDYWLLRICQNCINQYYRQNSRINNTTFEETIHFENSEEIHEEWGQYKDLVRIALIKLSKEQEEVVSLRYFSGLSYKEISFLCNIKTDLVRSRLHEAKKVLAALIPNLHYRIKIPQKLLKINKEQIMKKIDFVKKGAYVIKALSLDDQIHLCELIIKGDKFDDRLLKAFGKIKQGKEFVKDIESRLMISDFSRIITYAKDLDFWLIGNLDEINPEISEVLKRNTFVFEDIILLDPEYVKRLVKKVDMETLFKAMIVSDPIVKKYVMSFLSEEQQKSLLLRLPEIDTGYTAINTAQFDIVETITELANLGDIRVQRTDDLKATMLSNLNKQNVK